MSVDVVAEVLLYFIAKGIVTLPVAVDKALLYMPSGSHICQFYTRKEDLVRLLVTYFRQGLENNDACVWLVGDLTVEEARNALAAVMPARIITSPKDRCKSGITRSCVRTRTER